MINKVMLIGRLGRKPELKTTKNGISYCFLNLAIDSTKKGQDGSYEKSTDWISVKAYRKTAENCVQYLDKGRQVYVDAKLSPYESQIEDGTKSYSLDVIALSVQFLGTGEKRESAPQGYEEPQNTFDTFDTSDTPF